jgi:hypothetical protein
MREAALMKCFLDEFPEVQQRVGIKVFHVTG